MKYSAPHGAGSSAFNGCRQGVAASEAVSVSLVEKRLRHLALPRPPSGGASGGACSGPFLAAAFGSVAPPSSSKQRMAALRDQFAPRFEHCPSIFARLLRASSLFEQMPFF